MVPDIIELFDRSLDTYYRARDQGVVRSKILCRVSKEPQLNRRDGE
jgi:hypothetical protein